MNNVFAGSYHLLLAETCIDCLRAIYIYISYCVYGQHSGSVGSTVATHQDGPWFKSRLSEFAYSPSVDVCALVFLTAHMQDR